MRNERGSVLPLVALAMVMAGGGVLFLGRLGEAAVARAAAAPRPTRNRRPVR